MSATAIMRALLRARSQVTDLVPPARIFIGSLPQGTVLPAIGVRGLGGNEIRTMARNLASTTNRERVQVTVYSFKVDERESILLACKLGAGVHTGIIDGHKVNAVDPLGTNPEMPAGDDKILERSRDFMVTFKEAN